VHREQREEEHEQQHTSNSMRRDASIGAGCGRGISRGFGGEEAEEREEEEGGGGRGQSHLHGFTFCTAASACLLLLCSRSKSGCAYKHAANRTTPPAGFARRRLSFPWPEARLARLIDTAAGSDAQGRPSVVGSPRPGRPAQLASRCAPLIGCLDRNAGPARRKGSKDSGFPGASWLQPAVAFLDRQRRRTGPTAAAEIPGVRRRIQSGSPSPPPSPG
jgi:hypothetical protein